MGKMEAMNREQVIAMLREHETELKAAGVVRLSLFGSTARGDRQPDSDIDLLAPPSMKPAGYRCWMWRVLRFSFPSCSARR
jgi:predicted nucleotidyltransferase